MAGHRSPSGPRPDRASRSGTAPRIGPRRTVTGASRSSPRPPRSVRSPPARSPRSCPAPRPPRTRWPPSRTWTSGPSPVLAASAGVLQPAERLRTLTAPAPMLPVAYTVERRSHRAAGGVGAEGEPARGAARRGARRAGPYPGADPGGRAGRLDRRGPAGDGPAAAATPRASRRSSWRSRAATRTRSTPGTATPCGALPRAGSCRRSRRRSTPTCTPSWPAGRSPTRSRTSPRASAT